jgi:hypothetical protein
VRKEEEDPPSRRPSTTITRVSTNRRTRERERERERERAVEQETAGSHLAGV